MIKYKVLCVFVEIFLEFVEDRGIYEGVEVKLIFEIGEVVL